MAQSDSIGVDTGGIVVAVSTVVIVVAAFLAWATASAAGVTASINGIDLFSEGSPLFNGVATILFGLIATVLVLAAPDNEAASVVAAVLGAIVVLIALAFVVVPETAFGGGIGGAIGAEVANPGIGIFLTILGGIGVLAGGAYSYAN